MDKILGLSRWLSWWGMQGIQYELPQLRWFFLVVFCMLEKIPLSLSLYIYIYWASWWLDEVITEYDVHWQIIYLHFLINRLVILFDFLMIQCFFFRWHVNWGHLTRGISSMNRVYLEANSQKNNLISLKCTLLGTDLSGYIHHNFILFWVILGVIIHHHFSTDLFTFLNEVRWTFYPWRNFVICKVLIQHSYYPIVELFFLGGGGGGASTIDHLYNSFQNMSSIWLSFLLPFV